MPHLFEIDDNVVGFRRLVTELLNHGHSVGSRVGSTLELEDVTISLRDPRKAFAMSRPGYSYPFGLVEGAQLVSGTLNESSTRLIAPRMTEYSDFHGAYGIRTLGQIPRLLEELKANPDSRRAVLSLWNPALDLPATHKDHPCTLVITFRIRGGRLNMSVHMRSNDVWLGWAYDAVQFAALQATLATLLDVEVGTYTHHADSFHLYHNNLSDAIELSRRDPSEVAKLRERFDDPHMLVTGFAEPGMTYEQVKQVAIDAMDPAVNLDDDEAALHEYGSVPLNALTLNKAVRFKAAKAAEKL